MFFVLKPTPTNSTVRTCAPKCLKHISSLFRLLFLYTGLLIIPTTAAIAAITAAITITMAVMALALSVMANSLYSAPESNTLQGHYPLKHSILLLKRLLIIDHPVVHPELTTLCSELLATSRLPSFALLRFSPVRKVLPS